MSAKDQEGAAEHKPAGRATKRSQLAQVPSTVLTVEYVDGGEGMDAALKALDERLKNLESMTQELRDTCTALLSVIEQQAKDLEQFMESVKSRLESAAGGLGQQTASA